MKKLYTLLVVLLLAAFATPDASAWYVGRSNTDGDSKWDDYVYLENSNKQVRIWSSDRGNRYFLLGTSSAYRDIFINYNFNGFAGKNVVVSFNKAIYVVDDRPSAPSKVRTYNYSYESGMGGYISQLDRNAGVELYIHTSTTSSYPRWQVLDDNWVLTQNGGKTDWVWRPVAKETGSGGFLKNFLAPVELDGVGGKETAYNYSDASVIYGHRKFVEGLSNSRVWYSVPPWYGGWQYVRTPVKYSDGTRVLAFYYQDEGFSVDQEGWYIVDHRNGTTYWD